MRKTQKDTVMLDSTATWAAKAKEKEKTTKKK